MAESDRASRLELLIARQEIEELHAIYMHAQDRLDPALHRSVFHDNATTDYGSMSGTADEFVAWAQAALREMQRTHHMLGQAWIEFEGDRAFGEVYFQAHHRLVTDDGEMDLFISGRYIDRYERRAGIWKIAHRSEIIDWERLEPATEPFLEKYSPGSRWGERGDADRSRQRELLRRL